MKPQITLYFGAIFGMISISAMATTFPTTTTPFSQYGQIQNVQNYSSNPFWNPNAPYNQRMPTPVYVQGTDVSTADCQTVVGALVASYCASRNNCIGIDVDDARPTLTVQLASLPNHNYVTPCAGFIDTEFDEYISQNAFVQPGGTPTAFPAATTPNTNAINQQVQFSNPYQQQLPTWNGEPWAQEKLQREQELKNLQSASDATDNSMLVAADFPTTVNDISFSERMQNAAAGYAPYKDASAYEPLNIESEEKYIQRMQALNMAGMADGTLSQPGATGATSPNDAASSNTNFCSNAATTLATLQSDLITLQNCQNSKKKFSECYPDLKGSYPTTSFSTTFLSGDTISQNQGYSRSKTRNQWWSFVTPSGIWTLFSASDCLIDPITGNKTCCNTAHEKNDRKVNIGGFMFCGEEIRDADGNITGSRPIYGLVRQCLQNNRKRNTVAAGAVAGAFQNDFWDQQCIPRYCDDEIEPASGIESALVWMPDKDNICWRWDCPANYTKLNNTCVANVETEEYQTLINTINSRIREIQSRCKNI